jgi:HAD superfamily hydrolase (TIGR01662 family)
VGLKAVFFDVGETLVDEQAYWAALARRTELDPHVLWAALGITIARGEDHTALWGHLGIERPSDEGLLYHRDELFPDAIPTLEELRSRGYFVGIAGNQTAALEAWARSERLTADVVATSAGWGVRKPDLAFFERLVSEAGCAAGEVAYVGDRVDNDVVPARAAGLVAVHVRRGPWGHLQRGAEQAHIRLDSLAELPEALVGV